jgi:hypothetical protein
VSKVGKNSQKIVMATSIPVLPVGRVPVVPALAHGAEDDIRLDFERLAVRQHFHGRDVRMANLREKIDFHLLLRIAYPPNIIPSSILPNLQRQFLCYFLS